MQNIKKIIKKKEYKLFDLPIRYTEYTPNWRYSKWLGGLLITEKIQDDFHAKRLKKGYIGKFLLWQYGYQNNLYSIIIMGISIFHKEAHLLFFKRYGRFVVPNTDHIYIINSDLGELYCFLAYFVKLLLIQDQVKHPLFWVTQFKHREMIRLFYPHAKVVYIGQLYKYFADSHFICDNIPCTCVFSSKYYATSVEGMLAGKTTYFRSMVHALHLKNLNKKSLKVGLVQISDSIHQSALNKLTTCNLQDTHFVFIAPEAITCQQLPWNFWNQVVTFCNKQGWKCFFNIVHSTTLLPKGAISCPLSLTEALVFAKHARCIISLKSGLSELLLQTGKPLHVIYTNFSSTNRLPMTAQQVYAGFKMEQLPHFHGQSKLYSYVGTENLFEQLTKNLI